MLQIIKFIWHIRTFLFIRLNHFRNLIALRLFKVTYEGLLQTTGRIYLHNSGEIKIGKNVTLNSQPGALPSGRNACISLQVKESACLTIGHRVGITCSAIFCAQKVTIEDDVFIGEGCLIIDTDFHSSSLKDRMKERHKIYQNIKTSPVILRRGCFIGAKVIILKGVEIGERSIIGAGSTVSKSIPARQIWGGNPAHYIRDLRPNEID